jgi:hypothetical protein
MDETPALEYRMSEAVGELFGALAKAQGEIKNAAKDADNPHFRSKYAGLASIADACRGPLSKHGIAVIQIPYNSGRDVGLTTIFGHSTGQWISGSISVAPAKFDAQGVGSVLTYLRRYSLAAMASVAPSEDDDDGEAAVSRATFAEPVGAPVTRGATRTAAPRKLPPAPVAVAGNGDAKSMHPAWIDKFFAQDSYEIDPARAGGWSAWEKFYLTACDHATNIDQVTQLENDNGAHFAPFREAVKAEVYDDFRSRIEAAEKRLWRQPDTSFVNEMSGAA